MSTADLSGGERRCRDLRELMRDGQKRNVDQMRSALDTPEYSWTRADVQAAVEGLLDVGHLINVPPVEAGWSAEPAVISTVYPITKAGADSTG